MALPRPIPKSEQLITTDTPEWRDRLDDAAGAAGLSRSSMLRYLMRDGLDRLRQDKKVLP